jgi:hypothetical protein
MLGLTCHELPVDRASSAIAALACFPMYMVANVHGWTSDRQPTVPVLDIPGSEAIREAFAIGREEARVDVTDEHRKVIDSMLTARPADRVVYEYALETLKQYLSLAQPAVAAGLRAFVAGAVVDVAAASGKRTFGAGEKISPQERECIAHIADELQLRDAPKAQEILDRL